MEKELFTLDEILEEIKTEDSESYQRIIEMTEQKIAAFKARGGARANAGRKKTPCPKLTCSFSLPNEIVIVIENYSKEHCISKSKALEEIIQKGLLSA